MPTTCEEMMNAASPYVWPQACMAIGVEVMRKFIDAVADRAGKYRDDELRLAAISARRRPDDACSAAVGVGMRTKRSRTSVIRMKTMSER